MKFYTIYKTVNKENGKTYIGKHITKDPYDGYIGSGKYLKWAIQKYGIENFEKFILFIFDNKEDMDNKEAELVNEEYLKIGETYNLKLGGQGGFDHIYSSSEIATRVGRKGYNNGLGKFTKEKRIEVAKKAYDKNLKLWVKSKDPEIIKKRKEKAGNAFRGKYHTKETRNLMSVKQKLVDRTGNKNPNYGNCWIYSNSEMKSQQIKKDDLQMWLENGWIKGRKIKF